MGNLVLVQHFGPAILLFCNNLIEEISVHSNPNFITESSLEGLMYKVTLF